MDYDEALAYSNEIVSLLFRYCMRLQSTGALRRKEVKVDPVEMLACPQVVEANSYWNQAHRPGGEPPGRDRLEAGIAALAQKGALKLVESSRAASFPAGAGRGPRYLLEYRGALVVVYTVNRLSEWGVEFLLRTGDDDFVEFLVRKAAEKGLAIIHGQLQADGKPVDAPEESDVLTRLGLEWVEPDNRNRDFVRRRFTP